jgi:hypothetical protein
MIIRAHQYAYWRKKGGISKQDLEGAYARRLCGGFERKDSCGMRRAGQILLASVPLVFILTSG